MARSPKSNSGKGKTNKNGIPYINDVNEKDFCDNKTVKIVPRNQRQKEALESLEENYCTFLIGSVGGGKTHLAVSFAIKQLIEKKVKNIILLRPATIHHRESLGFLKGDMQEKIAPLVMPMKIIAEKAIGKEGYARLEEAGAIQAYSLGHIEGLTYEKSIVILDEFQNTESDLLYAVLSRITDDSKVIVMGDFEQCKLRDKRLSAFHDVEEVLSNIEGIGIVEFLDSDIVRGKFTKLIAQAYKVSRYND